MTGTGKVQKMTLKRNSRSTRLLETSYCAKGARKPSRLDVRLSQGKSVVGSWAVKPRRPHTTTETAKKKKETSFEVL